MEGGSHGNQKLLPPAGKSGVNLTEEGGTSSELASPSQKQGVNSGLQVKFKGHQLPFPLAK